MGIDLVINSSLITRIPRYILLNSFRVAKNTPDAAKAMTGKRDERFCWSSCKFFLNVIKSSNLYSLSRSSRVFFVEKCIEGWGNRIGLLTLFLSILLFSPKETLCIEKNCLENLNQLENFQNQLKEYKPNAPWVMQELLNLQIKDFFKGLELSILMLAQSTTRQEYFNEKNGIDISELYAKSLWQCTIYEIFLKNIYLKSNDKQLDIFQVTKKLASQNGLVSILDIAQQLDIAQGNHHPLFVFYAFFCDCLVNQFSETIKFAYSYIDTPKIYKSYCQLAVKFNKQIKEKVSRLKNWSISTYDKTKYEAIYAELYEKNQQIINLLKQQGKQSSYHD